MGARFTDTDKWSEDWYCELGGEYQKLWDYICDKCDNAGIWKPNKIDFESKTKFKVSLDSFFQKVNGDKERILTLGNGRWFIRGFIKYQWFNKKDVFSLNLGNKLHASLYLSLIRNDVLLEKVRGLRGVLKASKEKDTILLKEVITDNNSSVPEASGRPLEDLLPPPPQNDEPIRAPNAPAMQQVIEFFYQQGKTGEAGKQSAEAFFYYYEGLGWRVGITPIYAWRPIAQKWIANPISQKQNQNGNTQTFAKRSAGTPATGIISDDKNYGKF